MKTPKPFRTPRSALRTLLFCLLPVACCFPAFAQDPMFTYQGRLDDNRAPASGLYDFRFTIYNAPDFSGPTSALSVTPMEEVAVSNGLFTVQINGPAWLFNGQPRWLAIEVRTNGPSEYTLLEPWTELTPTPYAIRALTVTTNALDGGYPGAVNFSNPGNTFVGGGAGLTGLNASQLTSGTVPAARLGNAWRISGNNGTTPGTHFIGNTDNQALDFRVDNRRALRLEPTGSNSVNVVGGWSDNYIEPGVVGATIAGGGAGNYFGFANTNRVLANLGTVGGGGMNTSGAESATVGGGVANTASGPGTTVGGGFDNRATGYVAVVSGGWNNTAAAYGTVGGGERNTATGFMATVGGGFTNTASGGGATVTGGFNHTASGYAATVGGGYGNIASGEYATVPGGSQNSATNSSTFAAGRRAKANHQGAFVWADSTDVNFGSDRDNQFKLRANGGVYIVASGNGLSPAAFRVESVSGNPVGLYVIQTNSDAAAVFENRGAGDQIKAFNGPGSQVFRVDNDGDVFAKSFTPSSDRHRKENFEPICPQAVLAKVIALPITRWNFKGDAATPHVGPMAQDFHAAFGLGANDTTIATVDADGVALAAIQGLNQKLERKLEQKGTEIMELQGRLAALEQLVARMNPKVE